MNNKDRAPTDEKLIEEEIARRLGPPDGTCLHCHRAADALLDVGPLRISIDEPEPGSPRRKTSMHEFCSWECLAEWAAIQAGGEFRDELSLR